MKKVVDFDILEQFLKSEIALFKRGEDDSKDNQDPLKEMMNFGARKAHEGTLDVAQKYAKDLNPSKEAGAV